MQYKDMKHSDWTRITRRTYLSKPICLNGVAGLQSLIVMHDVASPLTVHSTGKAVKIVEKDYSWLQIALKDSPVWLTAMFDETGRLLQIYFDLTAGNRFDDPENPCFLDMYLDVVLHDDGERFVLDQDELDEALASGEITCEQHRRTQADCAALCDLLSQKTDALFAYCRQAYAELQSMRAISG